MHSSLPPLGWHTFLTTWQLAPVWTALRPRGARALREPGSPPAGATASARCTRSASACFVAGLALLLLTVSSAIDVYAMALMWMHMIEHLMLIMVVPALLVLGSPLTVLRAAAATRGREARVDAVLQGGVVSVLTHPAVAILQYSVVIVATHLTSFMDVMARHDWVMHGGAGALRRQWLPVHASARRRRADPAAGAATGPDRPGPARDDSRHGGGHRDAAGRPRPVPDDGRDATGMGAGLAARPADGRSR